MITLDDVKASKLRQTIHFDGPRGPKGFFGDYHQGIQFPRLQRKTTYWRATRGHTVEWLVDGTKVESLEAAIDAMNAPPVTSAREDEALALIGNEWADLRKVIDYEVSTSLRNKGLIEMEHGKYRRPPA